MSEFFPVIQDFAIGFQRDPDANLEDSEWRKRLFTALFQHAQDLAQVVQLERASVDVQYGSELGHLQLTPVRTAYPLKEKFDIALLDPASRTSSASSEDRHTAYWSQPLQAALTLHLCTDEALVTRYFRKLDKDLDRFAQFEQAQDSPFRGIALLLVTGEVPGADSLVEQPLEETAGHQAWVIAETGTFRYQP